MKVHYISCAVSSSVDNKSNQLSLFHILDEINAPAFPATLPSFCVAALFEREIDDPDMPTFILAISLDDAMLASFTMKVDFTKSRRNRSIHTIQGMAIPKPGQLTIAIVQKNKELAVWRALALWDGTGAPPSKPASKAVEGGQKASVAKPAAALN